MRRYLSIGVLFLALVAITVRAQTPNWTAVVTSQSSDINGNHIVALRFVDGLGHSYEVNDFIPLGAVPTQLSDFAATTITSLQAQAAAAAAAPVVGGTVIPTVSAPLDPNIAVKIVFKADYLLLREYQTAISNQLITAADSGYVTQLAKVRAEFAANESVLLPLVQVGP